jgi:hypothetical protein
MYAGREIVIARCFIQEEHKDNDRFAADVVRWANHDIVNLIAEEYQGSVFNVIQRRKYVSGNDGAPCTLILKKQVREAFQRPDDVHVFGYCAEELDRWDRFLDANNINAVAPLIDRGITHPETLAIIERAGIELPAMYKLGYQHNNCIGCVKASGAGYWNKVRQDFPDRFWMMAGASRALGAKLTRINNERIYLDELPQGVGDYQTEPEIQCGVFCEMAEREIAAISKGEA